MRHKDERRLALGGDPPQLAKRGACLAHVVAGDDQLLAVPRRSCFEHPQTAPDPGRRCGENPREMRRGGRSGLLCGLGERAAVDDSQLVRLARVRE